MYVCHFRSKRRGKIQIVKSINRQKFTNKGKSKFILLTIQPSKICLTIYTNLPISNFDDLYF